MASSSPAAAKRGPLTQITKDREKSAPKSGRGSASSQDDVEATAGEEVVAVVVADHEVRQQRAREEGGHDEQEGGDLISQPVKSDGSISADEKDHEAVCTRIDRGQNVALTKWNRGTDLRTKLFPARLTKLGRRKRVASDKAERQLTTR